MKEGRCTERIRNENVLLKNVEVLDKWFAQTELGRYWEQTKSDGSFAKCGRSQNKRKMQNGNIQNASLLAKATANDRLAKRASAVKDENRASGTRSRPVNQLEQFQHLQKEKKMGFGGLV